MSADLPNLFPALDAATESALRESIQRFGVLVPVVRDQHGRILDGHHRSRIADEANVKYRVDVVRVEDDEQAHEIAATLNTDRRQLTAEQRHEVVATLREQGHSLRAIAGAVGVSKSQIANDLADCPPLDNPARVQRQGGGTYPAKRPTLVAAKDTREADRAQAAFTGSDLPAGRVLDVKRAERIAREQKSEAKRAEPVQTPEQTDADCIVLHGDFRDALADQDLVGATVITDPPYPREFLPEWRDMAQAMLKWGCEQLVAMSGQSTLPDVIDAIREATRVGRWYYRWCGAYMTIGPATRVWGANVGTSWKPILVFDRIREREFLTTDVFRSSGDDKRSHHWGQNEDGIAALVEAFTKPGDTVVDPFLGGGTTAVVCKALGRRFVGCDIDAAAVDATRQRLAA